MNIKRIAMMDMVAEGLNVSVFMYDECFDGRWVRGVCSASVNISMNTNNVKKRRLKKHKNNK